MLALITGLVVACAVKVGPVMALELQIMNDSGGRVRAVDYSWNLGPGEFRVRMAPGVADSEGPDIACRVVRPALQGSEYEGKHFEVVNSSGNVVATDRTPCP
jgi:hypothetical protein